MQSSVSFDLPHLVVVSALSTLSDCLALSVLACMWGAYVSFGSSVSPNILGFLVVGSVVFSIFRFSWRLYSAGSGVKRVVIVLSAFRVSWLSLVQVWMSLR